MDTRPWPGTVPSIQPVALVAAGYFFYAEGFSTVVQKKPPREEVALGSHTHHFLAKNDIDPGETVKSSECTTVMPDCSICARNSRYR